MPLSISHMAFTNISLQLVPVPLTPVLFNIRPLSILLLRCSSCANAIDATTLCKRHSNGLSRTFRDLIIGELAQLHGLVSMDLSWWHMRRCSGSLLPVGEAHPSPCHTRSWGASRR